MSNLRLIKKVDGTGATSVSVTDVFNSDFDIYKIEYFCVNDSGSPKGASLRLINSNGSVISSSLYDRAIHQLNTNVNFSETYSMNADKATDAFGNMRVVPEGASGVMWVFNPYSTSAFTTIIQTGFMNWNASRAGTHSVFCLKELTSVAGFQAFLPETNLTTDTYFRVYGLRVE